MIVILTLLIGATLAHAQDPSKFYNPISNKTDDFPGFHTGNVLRLGDFYYFTYVKLGNSIAVIQSPILTNFENQPETVVYRADYMARLTSQMVQINGSLYIYFEENSHLHVMQAKDPQKPRGSWGQPFNMSQTGRTVSFNDGTVMVHNDNLYLLSSRSYESGPPNEKVGIFIQPMISPTEVSENEGVLLREVGKREGECSSTSERICSNSLPRVTSNNGTTFVIFTANSFDIYSGIGFVSIAAGLDPMNASNWREAPGNGPAFSYDEDENVWEVCAATFTTSPDGTETWMVYHATQGYIAFGYSARIQMIRWNAQTGNPEFPVASGLGTALQVPSGQD